jgi:hypothetical protein
MRERRAAQRQEIDVMEVKVSGWRRLSPSHEARVLPKLKRAFRCAQVSELSEQNVQLQSILQALRGETEALKHLLVV